MIDITAIKYTKKQLSSAPKAERLLYLQFAQLSNDIANLSKLLIFSMNKLEHHDIEVVWKGQLNMTIMLMNLLAGRTYEGWKVIEKDFSPLHKVYDKLISRKSIAILDEIKLYHNQKDSLIKRLRHKFAYHSDNDYLESGFEKLPEEEQLIEYLNGQRGNTLYHSSQTIIIFALVAMLPDHDPKKAVDAIFHDVLVQSDKLNTFILAFMSAFLVKYIKNKLTDAERESITLPNVPYLKDVTMPFFCIRDEKRREFNSLEIERNPDDSII